jgi:hypothetical protein
MIKLLITALFLGTFAMTGVSGSALAGYRPCTNAPKVSIPCPVNPQVPLPSKPKGV